MNNKTDYNQPSDTLFIEKDITGTEHRLNIEHVRRDGWGRLHLPALKNEFKIQCPSIVADTQAFEKRFDDKFNGVWLDIPSGSAAALRRFFKKEVELICERLDAPRRAAVARERVARQREQARIRAYMNPDQLGLPLETGLTSNEPINVCWSPTQLLMHMNDLINDRNTPPAQRSELESHRFTLCQRLNGVHKVWLTNGIDPTEHDDGYRPNLFSHTSDDLDVDDE
ncbi:hypothetical protein [Shewanella algae]|uniref:hypothetical protein n=1 Tax=Shewanella algae TaxID=38313 RepID=UPI001AAD147D|nr:hypothetical protein [Shewanella algae]MBO2699902.1 hypothetical protein [Shewanella algae]